MSDEQFLTAFELGTLPKEEFSHRQHVRLAWLYLGRLEFADAARRVVEGIKAFAALHGATGLYHETMTQAWLRLIADGRRRAPGAETFAAFLEANPALAVKGALDPYYDPATLRSDEARARFVAPDRAPLPEGGVYSRSAMPFHTERLTCKGCSAVFIVGGERIDVPGDFHFFQVACPRCQAKVDATWDGEVKIDTLQVMADGA